MASGDFSASALQNIQLELARLFQGGATQNIINTPFRSVQEIGTSQTMVTVPVMQDGRCISWKVFWLTDGASAVSYSGTSADGTLLCDIPAGHEAESGSKTYSPNVFIREDRSINDNLCANEYDFASLSAFQLARAMAMIREELNKKAIQTLNANAMTPAAGSTEYTINGTKIEIPATDFNEDLIAELAYTAELNQVLNAKILTGRNFYTSVFNANYNASNMDEKDQVQKLGHYPIVFDPRAIDTVIGEAATFMFDPDVIGFFNQIGDGLTYTAELTDPQSGIWEFLMDDPILKYRRISRRPDGGIISEIVPVTYRVEYQKVCDTNGRDTNGRRVYDHKYSLHFVGGFPVQPAGADSETNIIKFVKVAGV